MSVDTVDVDAALDRVRFRGLPLIILICSAVTLALDGFDIQLIGFVAPVLTAEFAVGRGALAPTLAASLIGMTLGGLCVGPIGDRMGRRTALLISTLVFGAGTLLGSTASSLQVLTFWRLLTGIGLGGALPNTTALMVEFSPPRWRSQTVAVANVGVPIGGMIGAAITASLLPLLGWRAIFALGGALPLIWFVVMHFVMPESPRYLANRRDKLRELVAILNRIEGKARYSGDATFVLSSSSSGKGAARLGALFSRELARDTLAAWVIFGTNNFAVYAFFNWAPVAFTARGLDLATAVRGALVFNLAGVLGVLALSWGISRFGSRRPLTLSAAFAAGSLFYLAWLAQVAPASAERHIPAPALMAGVALAGLTICSIQVGMLTVSAHIYPIECRASGVGWATGVGRLDDVLPQVEQAFQLSTIDLVEVIRTTEEFYEYPMCDSDPLRRWSFGRVTLLGDAAHPMYPYGSNGASQAILDASCIASLLAEKKDVVKSLKEYEAERLPATTKIVQDNRIGGPERVIDVMEERAPNGFVNLNEVVSHAELEAIVKRYSRTAGFDQTQVNR